MTTEPSYRPFIPTTSAVTQLIRLEQNLADHGGEPDETHRRLRLWWRNLPDQQRAALLRHHDQTKKKTSAATKAEGVVERSPLG
jgi:hypothetical protein